MDINKLKELLKPHEIEWKVQSYTKTDKTIVVPYIDNRAVMNRFDDACGVENWKSSFAEVSIGKGGFMCTISVKIDNEWVSKSDGASVSDIAPIKGGVSDSMKRCAVQWGLGRDLYDYPRIMINGKIKYIDDSLLKLLHKVTTGFNDGRELQKVYVLNIPNKQ